jgi:hypothetical protein
MLLRMTNDRPLPESLPMFDTDEGCAPFTLGQFRLSNIEAPEIDEWMATMESLSVGDAFTVGGGAGAETTIRRVR